MNPLSTVRTGLVWVVPLLALAALLLWQTDWGRAFALTPPAEATVAPKPLTVALLPDYQAPPAPAGSDMVERTLFNPTRRPAPAALREAEKPKIQRGQFTLTGTLAVDGKATAYLREVNGGKQRRVTPGEVINGMTVAEIKPDRVRLTLGEETEELVMKLAVGPKTTIQPVVPTAPVTASAAPGAAGRPQAQPGGATPTQQPRDVAEILAERRRAARAAEAAAQGRPPGAPIAVPGPTGPVTAPNMAPPPVVDPNAGDARWQQLYQRYQQPRR